MNECKKTASSWNKSKTSKENGIEKWLEEWNKSKE